MRLSEESKIGLWFVAVILVPFLFLVIVIGRSIDRERAMKDGLYHHASGKEEGVATEEE